MLSNALMYNSSEHSVYAMAKEMHEEVQATTHHYISFIPSSSYSYPTRWDRYNMLKDSAIIFTTGRLPDVNPP
jgi:hypothetical protein